MHLFIYLLMWSSFIYPFIILLIYQSFYLILRLTESINSKVNLFEIKCPLLYYNNVSNYKYISQKVMKQKMTLILSVFPMLY